MFEDEPRGPLFRIQDQTFAEDCLRGDTCDILFAMSCMRGLEGAEPGVAYSATIACHGLRMMTEKERQLAQDIGRKNDSGQVCDMELSYTKPTTDL